MNSDPSTDAVIDTQRVVLHAERLVPVMTRVQARRAVLKRRVTTVRKTFEVDVLQEELVVDYVDGDGSKMSGDGFEPLVIVLHEEQVELVKHVRAVEEIRISKRLVVEEQQFTEAVRHERLEVVDTPA